MRRRVTIKYMNMHNETCTAVEEGCHQEGAGAGTQTGTNLNGSATLAPLAALWVYRYAAQLGC